MSLLDEAMETCVFLNKQVTDDGYGGGISEVKTEKANSRDQ